ncbi:MAG TPA: type VI secretion system contractile sheath large subunit [Terriglobia bacterium]|nr:type VI secretion system contractile sheath large subunit [Terriglobia bacterium]
MSFDSSDRDSRFRVVLGDSVNVEPARGGSSFRMAILGDFSGRANRQLLGFGTQWATRRPVEVDRDNFDEVLAKLKPELRIRPGTGDAELALRFAGLDNFHPDHLYEHLEVFARLRELRRRLADRSTFAEAAAELGLTPRTAAVPSRLEPPGPAPREGGATLDIEQLASGSLLDQVIEQAGERPVPPRGRDEWGRFLHDLVAPHLAPGADPRQPEVLAEVDRAVSDTMRAILHHADFQALESAWRAVFFLVRRLETDSNLKLFLIDVSKGELAADLSGEGLAGTATYRLLVEQIVKTPGAVPWAVLAGNYTFAANLEDVNLLVKLGQIAAAAGAPFLAAASASLVGCDSLASTPDPAHWTAPSNTDGERAWQSLRRRPEADYLGLALPRYIQRLPYGEATDACEGFDFEELTASPLHEDYLWANPAFACAFLLGEEYSRSGSEMRPRGGEINGLPLHTYRNSGEWAAEPCAEVLLTETAAESILERGLMALVSFKGRDAVRLVRFQSIADPPRGLSGPWS